MPGRPTKRCRHWVEYHQRASKDQVQSSGPFPKRVHLPTADRRRFLDLQQGPVSANPALLRYGPSLRRSGLLRKDPVSTTALSAGRVYSLQETGCSCYQAGPRTLAGTIIPHFAAPSVPLVAQRQWPPGNRFFVMLDRQHELHARFRCLNPIQSRLLNRLFLALARRLSVSLSLVSWLRAVDSLQKFALLRARSIRARCNRQ